MQDKAFLEGEGDAWWQRNRDTVLGRDDEAFDPPLAIIEACGIHPKRVLEIGCANGWRLRLLKARYGCECVGVDASEQAIEEGREGYREPPDLRYGSAAQLPISSNMRFDLVVMNFVLHWVDRNNLLKVLTEADRALEWGGHMVIGDFWPRNPTKTIYHHCEGLWTYKLDYPDILVDTGNYTEVAGMVYHYGERDKTACIALKKEDCYRIS